MKHGTDVFVIYKQKILFILRDNLPNIPNPNMWNLPGGGIEDGETALEAAKREVFEEISLKVALTLIDHKVYSDGNDVTYFIVHLDDNEKDQIKLGDEGQRFEFFSLEESLSQNIFPNLMTYIKENKNILIKLIA